MLFEAKNGLVMSVYYMAECTISKYFIYQNLHNKLQEKLILECLKCGVFGGGKWKVLNVS
jgi:hypothetical protein